MAGASEKEKEKERERTVPSSRPLHNFALPPHLQWGYQKQLRGVKISNLQRSPTSSNCALNSASSSVDHLREPSNSPIPVPRGSFASTARKNLKAKSPINNTITPVTGVSAGDTTGIEAVREKLLSDLKVAADQLKLPILEVKEKDGKNNQKKPSEEELPWNLRNRRPAGKASNEGGNVGPSLSQRPERGPRSLWASDKGVNGSVDQQRPRFSLTLSKEEIETDFLLMTGDKPPKRLKRRPKAVQKQMDALFPGSWLTEITPEYYKVSEAREPKGEK